MKMDLLARNTAVRTQDAARHDGVSEKWRHHPDGVFYTQQDPGLVPVIIEEMERKFIRVGLKKS